MQTRLEREMSVGRTASGLGTLPEADTSPISASPIRPVAPVSPVAPVEPPMDTPPGGDMVEEDAPSRGVMHQAREGRHPNSLPGDQPQLI